jgi:adenine deaminase
MNLRAMVRYGLTPYEALTTATRNAGDFLGEPLGRIAPGMFADLTILGGDPLTDITQAANVTQVMTAGHLHTVDDLLAPFESAAPAIPASPTLADLPDHPGNRQYWWHNPQYLAESKRSCCAET